jgi:hypothetical protein
MMDHALIGMGLLMLEVIAGMTVLWFLVRQ